MPGRGLINRGCVNCTARSTRPCRQAEDRRGLGADQVNALVRIVLGPEMRSSRGPTPQCPGRTSNRSSSASAAMDLNAGAAEGAPEE